MACEFTNKISDVKIHLACYYKRLAYNTHHIKRSLGKEALVRAIKLVLPGKVPAVDVIVHHIARWPPVLIGPLLHAHPHSR